MIIEVMMVAVVTLNIEAGGQVRNSGGFGLLFRFHRHGNGYRLAQMDQ